MYFFLPWCNSPPVVQGLLIIDASPSHSVGLIWTNDQPDNTQHSLETSMTTSRFETLNPVSEQPQTDALDCAVTETGHFVLIQFHKPQRRRKLTKVPSLADTGCPRRNVPDFGRVFLMLKYTDITQNTYIQS